MTNPTRIDCGSYVGGNVSSGQDVALRDIIHIHGSYAEQIWIYLDADLQDGLSMAKNQVEREGGEAITLVHLLQAVFRLRPDLAEEFIPLLVIYKEIETRGAGMNAHWKGDKEIDIHATLRAVFAEMLAKRDASQRLNCTDLLLVLQMGPTHPTPIGLDSVLHHSLAPAGKSGGAGSLVSGAAILPVVRLHRKLMTREEVQARWN